MAAAAIREAFKAVRVPAPGPSSIMRVESLARTALLPTGVVPPEAVLIRVHSVGVNPVETYIRSGVSGKPLSEFPYTPGGDCAGVIEEIGAGVSGLAVGDRVYTLRTVSGAYAELTLALAKYTYRIPESLTFHEAASVPTPYFTAYRALFQKLRVRPGATILVHGATGAVGVAAIQLARAFGMRVIGTAGSATGAEQIAPWCHSVVMHGTDTEVDDVMRATAGKGVNFLVEMIANVNLGNDLKMLARNGAVVVVGSRGDVTITPRELMRNESSIVGMALFAAADDELEESGALINAGLANGTLRPIVGHVFEGLESARAAHDEVIEHKGGSHGKIVMKLL